MEEYISKEKVKGFVRSGISTDTEADKEYVCAFIDSIPSADVRENIHGHWEVVSDGYGDDAYICECSECKDTVWVYKDTDRKWNYCPNCGAIMDEEPIGEKGK